MAWVYPHDNVESSPRPHSIPVIVGEDVVPRLLVRRGLRGIGEATDVYLALVSGRLAPARVFVARRGYIVDGRHDVVHLHAVGQRHTLHHIILRRDQVAAGGVHPLPHQIPLRPRQDRAEWWRAGSVHGRHGHGSSCGRHQPDAVVRHGRDSRRRERVRSPAERRLVSAALRAVHVHMPGRRPDEVSLDAGHASVVRRVPVGQRPLVNKCSVILGRANIVFQNNTRGLLEGFTTVSGYIAGWSFHTMKKMTYYRYLSPLNFTTNLFLQNAACNSYLRAYHGSGVNRVYGHETTRKKKMTENKLDGCYSINRVMKERWRMTEDYGEEPGLICSNTEL